MSRHALRLIGVTAVVLIAMSLSHAGEPASCASANEAPGQSPKPHEFRVAVRSALKQEVNSSGAEYEPAVRELVRVHRQLQGDVLLVRDERLQLTHIVKQRLQRASTQIEKKSTKNKAKGEKGDSFDQTRTASLGTLANIIQESLPGQWQEPPVAAQQFAFGGNGPRLPQAASGPRRPTTRDRGQELVELIQTTIAPDTWDVKGGLGTIVYFAPGKSLVVRQTSEVHGNLGGLIRDLRK